MFSRKQTETIIILYLRLFDLSEFIVWNIKGLRHLVAKILELVAKTQFFCNLSFSFKLCSVSTCSYFSFDLKNKMFFKLNYLRFNNPHSRKLNLFLYCKSRVVFSINIPWINSWTLTVVNGICASNDIDSFVKNAFVIFKINKSHTDMLWICRR